MADNYRVKIIKQPDVTDLAGEKVMIDFDSGKYFLLTGSANDIWDLLKEDVESDSIVTELIKIYEVETDECRESVLNFLNELESKGFVTLEKCD